MTRALGAFSPKPTEWESQRGGTLKSVLVNVQPLPCDTLVRWS